MRCTDATRRKSQGVPATREGQKNGNNAANDLLASGGTTTTPRAPRWTLPQTALLRRRVPVYGAVPTAPRRPPPPCRLAGQDGPIYHFRTQALPHPKEPTLWPTPLARRDNQPQKNEDTPH